MSFGVGHRCSLDLVLLWLCRRLAAAALIQPLAWKPPYAVRAALKDQKKKKKVLKKGTSEPSTSAPCHYSGRKLRLRSEVMTTPRQSHAARWGRTRTTQAPASRLLAQNFLSLPSRQNPGLFQGSVPAPFGDEYPDQ